MKSYFNNSHLFSRVLITGANSYLGTSFEKWAKKHIGKLIITVTKTGDSSSNGIKPCMMAEVKNYDTSQEGTIKTWHFDGDTLTITRNYPPIVCEDVIIDN
ncbi:MAG: hypothetical protein IJP58_03920 [Clostridia bacterium]|nr:hypothetical protein [Clostridia bacterium]